jgi:hypothetical protein
VKLGLYVEGSTEKALPAFIKRWLDPRLPQPISVPPVPFRGVQDYLDHFADRVKLALAQQKIDGAVGLIDFYGSGLPYRGDTIMEQYKWARRHLESRVNDVRFIQHFAVHETEAWLLSDSSIFPPAIIDFLPKTQQPETINSLNSPASVLLDLYFRKLRKKYKKPVEGASLFSKLDPNVAYDRCPNLRLLLDDVLALAKGVV